MAFEAQEAERVFDFVNLTFGAFLSAYLGVQLAQSPPDFDRVIRIGALLVEIGFVGLSLRSLGIALIRGISTTKFTVASATALMTGGAAYVLTCRELGYPMTIMGVIGLAWLTAPLIGLIPLIFRRWIKIYD
ncbi:hypothetical protein [Rhizorhapis suberifaciens]|uniref:Uncharacterized protein n=1 Tax=Rhizorhapis suberifaciens TaxID=13656 RepID=A0A840HQV1_9SPHN|nr:hypothetical protein [Rhizorhapis suberifaciens]MBB4640000.1 hypothetical protein [Rhizorhapis suberifaciens]